jgi:hypothetical protein
MKQKEFKEKSVRSRMAIQVRTEEKRILHSLMALYARREKAIREIFEIKDEL